MSNLFEKWKESVITVYDSQELSTLELLEDITSFNDEIAKGIDDLDLKIDTEINNLNLQKTDNLGDHKGSWQGLNRPTLSDEGMRATVEKLNTEIPKLENEINQVNSHLEQKATKQEVEIERKRIDGFIALPYGTSQLDAEVIDSRLGANGKTYNSLGTAIREQFKENNENISSIVNGGVYPINVTFTNGGYVNNVQKKITVKDNYSYSEIIVLKKGETIKVVDGKCDVATVVDMLSKWSSDGTVYIASIYAYVSKNTNETYSYTATEELEYIRACYTTSFDKPTILKSVYSLKRINEDVEGISKSIENLKEVSSSVIVKNAEIIKINGSFCNAIYNRLTSNTGYFYTELYPLKKGNKITVTSKDSASTNVARISKWSSDGTSMIKVIETGTIATTTVSYTATEDIEYLRFSGQIDVDFIITETNIIISEALEAGIVNIIDEVIKTGEIIYPSLSMFETVGVCGDSYVKGQIYNSSGLVGDKPNLSWGKNLERLNGVDVSIYASSGADTNTWQSRWDCLPKVLSDTARGMYIFCLGINDYSYVTLGTLADITSYTSYNDYPNSFYGNYGKIIEQIKAHAPNSKICLMPPFYNANSIYYKYCINALKEITNHYSIPLIDTAESELAQSTFFASGLVGGHPTAILHSAMAKDITKMINKCIQDNYDYFKDYIGV